MRKLQRIIGFSLAAMTMAMSGASAEENKFRVARTARNT